MKGDETHRGPIAWMTRNSVAANLLMIVLIVGGLLVGFGTKQEVFPEFDLDMVSISVPYPGASPSEVETGIILAIEEAVRGLDGVKKVTSTANEGSGSVSVELLRGTDPNKALQDIKNAVDRITSFPEDAERVTVSLGTLRREVLSVVVYGNLTERVLRQFAEQVRDELLQDPGITLAELSGVRPLEISIEVPEVTLRKYNLTLDQIAGEVRRTAIELPGGGVKTKKGEILLRTAERRDLGGEFADIPIVSRPDGTRVELGDLANIIDGFAETDEAAYFNGKPAVMARVYRVGQQTPIGVATAARNYVAGLQKRLPPGVGVTTLNDQSDVLKDRVHLLLTNAMWGLGLVMLILGVFLDMRLAFWVTMGIPISFLGSFLVLPAMDVSINMISLFAFIMSLGIVVDDAVVVGENVYELRRDEPTYLRAAIRGAQLVAVPVVFSVLTNIAAFAPMARVSGILGKIFRVIPAVIVSVFVISLLESLVILPAHLGHQRPDSERKGIFNAVIGWTNRRLDIFSRTLLWGIEHLYTPFLKASIKARCLTVAIGVAVLVIMIGAYVGGRIPFSFFPKVESDQVVADAVLPFGSPVEDTQRLQERLVKAAREVLDELGGQKYSLGIFTQIGAISAARRGPGSPGGTVSKGHLANVQVFLVPSKDRKFGAERFAGMWRKKVGEVVGLESLTFRSDLGGPRGGNPIEVELSHKDLGVLERAAGELADTIRTYSGVKDVDDGFERGKVQFDFKLRPEARSLGVTATDLGRQVRGAFYGAEAFRQQRGRDEVKIMVRLPEDERRSEYNLEEMMIRAPGGGEIPLAEAAVIDRGRAYTEIKRVDGRRVVSVTGDLVPGVANAKNIMAELTRSALPDLMAGYPGLGFSQEGESRERAESLQSLGQGFVLALIVIFAMLAIPFKSYIQPLIIMVSIPFGIVGAVAGHLIMGYEVSIMSMMGIVALSGVVVNDSLVLIDAANRRHRDGDTPFEAITWAGARRFRPIMLTSLTTFFGLAPMIFETSLQARFLIPMAISLGFGILFSTLIALVLVPSLYLMVEDAKKLAGVKTHNAGDVDEDEDTATAVTAVS